MADQQQLEVLKSGVQKWNAWRLEHPEIPVDLTHADLSGTNLSWANLSGANMTHANLRTELRGTDLSDANLHAVNMRDANLRGANLDGTVMTGAILRRAILIGATFRDVNLSGAHLSHAILHETVLADLDLHTVVGLDSCRHQGPSILDHRTLMRSGQLPLVFLRGCGIPDSFIEYLPSLLNAGPIHFYSCFISYSTKDQEFSERLHADLQDKGVRCWFAPHNIQGGKKVHEQIDEAIRIYDRLLLILSPASMNSEWVRTEIAKSRKRELREGRRMLFPVRLVDFDTLQDWECFDGDTGKDSAREIREYFIPDFTDWKQHDSYNKAFERLLRDLRAN